MAILEEMDKYAADTIVTAQEPLGVCTVAQNVAKTEHFALELHFLNFRYRAGAFERRSKAVVEAADRFLLIHDGVSKGTRNELILVEKSRKPFNYITMAPDACQKPIDARLDGFVVFRTDNANADSLDFIEFD